MESNLLYYLWQDKLVTAPLNFLVSLDGTADVRANMTAFKCIDAMLEQKTLPVEGEVPFSASEKLNLLDYLFYSPKQLNQKFNRNKTQRGLKRMWCIKKSNAPDRLLDNNVPIFDQLKKCGMLDDVQRTPSDYTIEPCDRKVKSRILFLEDSDDDHDDIMLSADETKDDFDLSDNEETCYSIASYEPLCLTEPKRTILKSDQTVEPAVTIVYETPQYFVGNENNVWMFLPYFESLVDRSEVSKLLHYYKSKAHDLQITAMFEDFVVEEKVDMFYDQLYGEIKEPLKALQERYEKIKNGNYKHVKMWVVWEQELAKALEALKYRNMSEEALTYHQKTIKEIFYAWLETYKENNYVPYKFLKKFFR